ncbi:MAG TPA: cytochrome P450 [Propionicimonas sp.]|nr:cytochrome P450 [Propionicimonas sp.]HQA77373.1 cytochrome P450 [Propionicimonas sp.]HQD97145.1 cytochrome P450 [Propionicimonas sp.]
MSAAPAPQQRRAHRPGETDAPRVERDGSVWRIRSLETARQVLRARNLTTQAGFTSEAIPKGYLKHHPILISDGPSHDEQRRKVGRFFAPAVVAERYTGLMESCADALLAEAAASGKFRLDDLALYYAVEVTAEVVGLTDSPVRRMSRRLVSFFNQPPFDITRPDLGRTPRQWAQAAVNGLGPVLRFYLSDVRPAIRERRKRPRQDVISHLIAEDYTNADILVECVTYGTAGMVTTREFIAMAAWHLLTNDPLRERYLVAGQPERVAILNEIIRLEPVVGHLYRRAQGEFEIADGDQTWTVAAGDLLDLSVRTANTDPAAVGEAPLGLCPERPLPSGVNPAVLSFGDGAHKCPGQPLAILESDVFLTRLLALKPTIVTEPELGWDDLIAGYWLRNFQLSFPATI